jgi:hypothetical protein
VFYLLWTFLDHAIVVKNMSVLDPLPFSLEWVSLHSIHSHFCSFDSSQDEMWHKSFLAGDFLFPLLTGSDSSVIPTVLEGAGDDGQEEIS